MRQRVLWHPGSLGHERYWRGVGGEFQNDRQIVVPLEY